MLDTLDCRLFSFLIKVGQQNAQSVSWQQLPREAQSSCITETFERGGQDDCSTRSPHTNVEKGSLAAQDSPRVVGSRAISHVRGRVHYQPSPVHVGRVEVGENDTTLALRYCAARVWTGRWGCGSDRGDTAA